MKPLSRLLPGSPAPAEQAPAAPPAPDPASAAPADAASAAAQAADEATEPLTLPDDPLEVERLVTAGSSSRVRQLAAQSIQDPTVLKRLLRQVRDKDKSVYKIIKQKCDVLRAEEQRIAQLASDAAAACASLERHSHRIFDVVYVATFEHFEARWRALEVQAPPALRAQAAQAIERCRAVVDAHARMLAEQAAAQEQQAAERAARAAAQELAALEERRRHEALALAAEQSLRERDAAEQTRAERDAAAAQALRQIGGLIAKTHAELRDGHTGRAAGLRRALDGKLAALAALPPHLSRQLQQLDAKLGELKEWKDYAVAPKRAQLIADMEALIGSTESPQALADRIKQLQEDWKTISKGIVSDSEADWQRFHQAAVTAYQPCKAYFEEQAALRQENLAKRQAVVARLQAFEAAQSGEPADWRAVAAALREAPVEFRRHFPVDRAARLALQKEFDAVLGRLQQRLDDWHAQNVADKRALIDRAQRLLGLEDGREAVESVKRLQLQWKEIGAAPRDQERQLWEDFRKHCDAIFQKRQQAHDDLIAALETAKAQAVALCEEAERAAGLSGTELLQAAEHVPQWRAAFEALGELPRGEQRGLVDRFERALRRCRAQVAQQRALAAEQAYLDLLEAARLCNAYGWALARGAAHEAAQSAAEAFIAGRQWPKSAAQALKDATLAAAKAGGSDPAAHEAQLRLLCIRSEILVDAATPDEDLALRRNYQVQRLVRHMGQRSDAGPDELDALAYEWVRTGPVAETVYETLLARFTRCRSRRLETTRS